MCECITDGPAALGDHSSGDEGVDLCAVQPNSDPQLLLPGQELPLSVSIKDFCPSLNGPLYQDQDLPTFFTHCR